MLEEYLPRLDRIVDSAHVARSEALTLAAVSYEPVERIPRLVNCPVPGWPAPTYRETFDDMEKMLASQLSSVWIGAHVRDDRVYTVRANYGVGTVASMFGCQSRLVDDVSMPWPAHLSDEELDKILDSGKIDIESGLGGRVFETERYYLKMLSRYENLAANVHVFMCDTQGPFDSAHIIMGHKIYTEIYDNPERVHRLLDLVTDTTIRFSRAQREIIGESGATSYHTHVMVRGGVRACDDSGINLSPALYREFSKPYNERLFAEFGGGWIHYCGSGKQILADVLTTDGVTAVNFGNPEMQDLRSVYAQAAPHRVAILSWIGSASELPEEVTTGVTTMESAADIEAARALTGFRQP